MRWNQLQPPRFRVLGMLIFDHGIQRGFGIGVQLVMYLFRSCGVHMLIDQKPVLFLDCRRVIPIPLLGAAGHKITAPRIISKIRKASSTVSEREFELTVFFIKPQAHLRIAYWKKNKLQRHSNDDNNRPYQEGFDSSDLQMRIYFAGYFFRT